jgi:hypothetical protein
MSRSILEKDCSRSAHRENPTAEDDFALVLECIEGEAIPEDVMKLARKLDDALAQKKRRKLPN